MYPNNAKIKKILPPQVNSSSTGVLEEALCKVRWLFLNTVVMSCLSALTHSPICSLCCLQNALTVRILSLPADAAVKDFLFSSFFLDGCKHNSCDMALMCKKIYVKVRRKPIPNLFQSTRHYQQSISFWFYLFSLQFFTTAQHLKI